MSVLLLQKILRQFKVYCCVRTLSVQSLSENVDLKGEDKTNFNLFHAILKYIWGRCGKRFNCRKLLQIAAAASVRVYCTNLRAYCTFKKIHQLFYLPFSPNAVPISVSLFLFFFSKMFDFICSICGVALTLSRSDSRLHSTVTFFVKSAGSCVWFSEREDLLYKVSVFSFTFPRLFHPSPSCWSLTWQPANAKFNKKKSILTCKTILLL